MFDASDLLTACDPKEDLLFGYLAQAISLACRPFSPGKVTLWLGEKNDFLAFDASKTVVVECSINPMWPFSFEVPLLTIDMCCDYSNALKIADEAYAWFLHRPTQPVDDHIILGEN